MADKERLPQESFISALIHNYRHGGTTAEEMLVQIQDALELNPEAEATVREIPDVWAMLSRRQNRCIAEGVDIIRIHAVFLTRHINDEVDSLFRIDGFGMVEGTIPHNGGFDMVMGNATLSVFGVFREMARNLYSQWKGEYNDPNLQGDVYNGR